jgi:Ca2+-binding EF-hand superfamily protein
MTNLRRQNSSDITNQMMEKIHDENLMMRYGTSIQINMGKEYQKYLNSKYLTLRKEFEKINKDADDGIDLSELTDFLNSYEKEVGKHFERNYAEKLFEVMDKDRSNKISM